MKCVLVCSNCHKMLHRKRPWLSKEELKERKVEPQPQKQITLRGIKETLSKVFRKEKGER